DEFGALAFLHQPVCQAMYAAEPHNWCLSGGPLLVAPVGCADSETFLDLLRHSDQAIREVCAMDPACCDPAGAWDDRCVGEGMALVGRPTACQNFSALILDGFEPLTRWMSTQPLSLNTGLTTEGTAGLNVGGSGYRVLNGPAFRTPLWPPNASI